MERKIVNKQHDFSSETSVKSLLIEIQSWLYYIVRQWKILMIASVLGGIIGYGYYHYKKPLYKAECTFILDEKNSSVSGGASALTLLGIGNSGSSEGLYSINNLIWFYSSRLMIERTLLTKVQKDGKDILLIDWFLDVSGIKKNHQNDAYFNKVKFSDWKSGPNNSIETNKILDECVGYVKNNVLKAQEAPKTENVITITVQSENELFSKKFAEIIVNNVNEYYIENKVKRTKDEVDGLERKLNSLSLALGTTMYQTASEVDAIPNANPNKQTLRVAPQRKSIDVQANSAMYVELIKNLETAKLTLLRETPIIQVIDSPILPLPTTKWNLSRYVIIGSGINFIIALLLIIIIRYYKIVMNNEEVKI